MCGHGLPSVTNFSRGGNTLFLRNNQNCFVFVKEIDYQGSMENMDNKDDSSVLSLKRMIQDKDSVAGLDVAVEVMRKPENIERLAKALQKIFDEDPAKFFVEWIQGRLPDLTDGVGDVDFAPLTTVEEAAGMDEATSPRQQA